MSESAKNIGQFYGVYLLVSKSIEKRYYGKCYIGFTVNPNRRIQQHNRGKEFGGARKTNNKGPWKMVLIIHGFPNHIAALQFEWAWQQPTLSSRLKLFVELKRKLPKESCFQYNFRILNRMLQVGPWNRLPLIIQWIECEIEHGLGLFYRLPTHMHIIHGKIELSKMKRDVANANQLSNIHSSASSECHLCMQTIEFPERSSIGCLNKLCKLNCHLVCLANYLIAEDTGSQGHYIPIKGKCPLCVTEVTWAALLHQRANQTLKTAVITDSEDYDEHECDGKFSAYF